MTVSVGVIGCGYWGPNLVRAFNECDRAIVAAVCDTNIDRLMQVSRRYPTIRCYQEAEDLLDRNEIELVAIATPLDSHYSLAKAALQRGKHVLVEKPFTRTSKEAEELVELARSSGLILAVDHTFLFTPAVERIRELMDAGRIGKLQYVDSVRINLGVVRDELDVIWDLAPHDLSILDYLIGRMPQRVIATGSSHTRPEQVDVAYLNLDYGAGVTANFHLSWLSPVKVRRMILGGDRRMIIFDDLSSNEKLRVFESGMSPSREATGNGPRLQRIDYRVGDIWTPHLQPKEALAVQAEHIIEAIRCRTPLRSDGELGLRVVRVLEACQRSLIQDGGRVTIGDETARPATVSLPLDSLAPSVRHSEPIFADAFGLLRGTYEKTKQGVGTQEVAHA